MMKGIFKLRPSLPKYTVTYDPDVILKYMDHLPKNEQLNLEVLTKKLATLLCLLRGQRPQSIQKAHFDYASFQNGRCEFYIPKVLKTSRLGRHQEPLKFTKFPENPKICIIACIEEYKTRTLPLRNHLTGNDKQFIISYAPPHNPISSATIARYIKTFIELAGIDITVFTAHSTRNSSTSKANNAGLSVKNMQKAAGWSSSLTFTKY